MGWPLAHAHDLSDEIAPRPISYVSTDLGPNGRHLAAASSRLLVDVPELAVAGAGLIRDDALDRSSNPYRRALAEELGLTTRLFSELVIGDRRWLVELYIRDGAAVDDSFAAVLTNAGTQLGRVLERERSRTRIHDLAYTDPLTSLPNRRYLRESLEALFAAGRGATLLHVGLDRFKAINEALGHRAGDELLREISDRLIRAARGGTNPIDHDVGQVFRLGGDEFALVLDLEQPHDAAALGQKLLERVAGPCSTSSGEVFATASVGIAIAGSDGDDASALLRSADAALASAKRAGGNRFCFFSAAMNLANKRRLRIEHQLRRAVGRSELELRYQPIVAAATGEVVAAEALLRWTAADGEAISPAEFIPVAEASGQIDRLGSWVLRAACRQLAAWRAEGLNSLRLAINVSVDQLEDPSFVDMVKGVLDANGLEAGALELEITESRLVERESQVLATLDRLRRAGVGLALDDFGTGYSSLAHLRRLPIDRIKIDRSFVSNLEADSSGLALIEAVIQIARGLDLEVVAEGVESEHQETLLIGHGCDELQGYFYASPLTTAELARLCHGRRARARADTDADAIFGEDLDSRTPPPSVEHRADRQPSLA
jgi:diguanylate cyclase (GGDEF)-like protein